MTNTEQGHGELYILVRGHKIEKVKNHWLIRWNIKTYSSLTRSLSLEVEMLILLNIKNNFIRTLPHPHVFEVYIERTFINKQNSCGEQKDKVNQQARVIVIIENELVW